MHSHTHTHTSSPEWVCVCQCLCCLREYIKPVLFCLNNKLLCFIHAPFKSITETMCGCGSFDGALTAQTTLKCLPQSEQFHMSSLFTQGLTDLTNTCHEEMAAVLTHSKLGVSVTVNLCLGLPVTHVHC